MVLSRTDNLNNKKPKMDNPKNQIAQKLKEANNVLVTVSANPTVDQLAAAIGLTLLLNKLDKHASAVFSGRVPSTIEFLRPEDTIEKNTDSLRDFIISLDKSKADKLRYKVEDKMVKIFITPYRTSITDQDLIFSQGDFNVDVVVGIGVKTRDDLDQAIVMHGGILHDATVVSINTAEVGSIGSINWVDASASSLCEMIVAEAELLKAGLIDAQIATALLTGIVAETERFSNAKTTSNTMNASAKLMAAGANQQLVATQLEVTESKPVPEQPPQMEAPSNNNPAPPMPPAATIEPEGGDTSEDGTLEVEHQEELPEPKALEEDNNGTKEEGQSEDQASSGPDEAQGRRFMAQPPASADEPGPVSELKTIEEPVGSDVPEQAPEAKAPAPSLEATEPEATGQAVKVPGDLSAEELLETDTTEKPLDQAEPAESADVEPSSKAIDPMQFIETPRQTLDTIEHIVGSPHINAEKQAAETSEPEQDAEPTGAGSATEAEPSDIDHAREAVQAAMAETAAAPADQIQTEGPLALSDDTAPQDLPDIEIDPETGNIAPPPTVVSPTVQPQTPVEPNPSKALMPPPFALPTIPIDSTNHDSTPPPPVPPPMMPPINGTSTAFPSAQSPFSLPPAQ